MSRLFDCSCVGEHICGKSNCDERLIQPEEAPATSPDSTVEFKIMQFVKTIEKGWFEEIYSGLTERAATRQFESIVEQNPLGAFELRRIETTEKCLQFTVPQG